MISNMFCNKPEHLQNYFYCEDCAIDGKDVFKVFYCQNCCPRTVKNLHQPHKDQVKYIRDQKFTSLLNQIRKVLSQEIQSIKQKTQKQNSINFNETISKLKNEQLPHLKLLDEKYKLSDLLRDQKIMRWLLEIKFWEGGSIPTFMKFQSKLKHHIKESIIKADDKIKNSLKSEITSTHLTEKFVIQWPENNSEGLIKQLNEKISKEKSDRTKEEAIYHFVIKMFTSYSQAQCIEADHQCIRLIEQYPNSKVLYLCRIRLKELLPGGNKDISQILKKIIENIDPNFDSTDIFHYYTAMAQWEMIDEPEPDNGLIFLELKNKKYYKIKNVNTYIDSLNKSIAVRQKPVYLISLSLGYIVKENYKQAIRLFKKAASLLDKQNDPLDLDKFWAEIQNKTASDDFEAIMKNLETRTLQFVTNICKCLKTKKKHPELVQCCQELIIREPQNQNFKIQFIKSILSYSSTLEPYIYNEKDEKIIRAQKMIQQLKIVQQNEANQLQKRLQKVSAKHQYINLNFLSASDKYEKLTTETSLTTASDYYNFAASIFKLFTKQESPDEDNLKKAYQSIKKALKLKKRNTKYKKLMFFICCYMNKFNKAYECYEELKVQDSGFIKQTQYGTLIEYVKENIEF